MRKSTRIALTLPDELLEAIEAERQKSRQTRSEFLRRAAMALLRRRQQEHVWDEDYVRAYEQCPDPPEEVKAAGTAAGIQFAAIPWEE